MRSVLHNPRYILAIILLVVFTTLGFFLYSKRNVTNQVENKATFYQLLGGNTDWPLEIENQTADFAEGVYGSGAVIDWVAKKENGQWRIIFKLIATEETCKALFAETPPEYFNAVKRCLRQFPK